jgi:hypothetical protein
MLTYGISLLSMLTYGMSFLSLRIGNAIRKHGDQEDMKEITYVGMESK